MALSSGRDAILFGYGPVMLQLTGQSREVSPQQVASYRAGKQAVIGWFVGQLMARTKGKADPKFGLKPAAVRLADLLECDVAVAPDGSLPQAVQDTWSAILEAATSCDWGRFAPSTACITRRPRTRR